MGRKSREKRERRDPYARICPCCLKVIRGDRPGTFCSIVCQHTVWPPKTAADGEPCDCRACKRGRRAA